MLYRGGVGMWAWLLHRIAGVAIVLFLLLHVFDIYLIGWGPGLFDRLIVLYRHPIFELGAVGLLAALLFHALNGIRIIIVELCAPAARYHKGMFYAELVVFAVLFAPSAFIMLSRLV